MDKLRDETLVEILKKEKAYPHELRLLIPELQLLRDIYSGKRPKDAYEQDAFIVQVPMIQIVEDKINLFVGDTYLTEVGKTYFARHAISTAANHKDKRYIIHRVK